MEHYDGDRSLAGNPALRQYQLEDIASRLLFQSGQRFKKPSRVDCEKFAKFMGLNLRAENLSDSPFSLCVLAAEDQTLRTPYGAYVLKKGDVLIEKAIIERCDKKLYNYAIMHACAHAFLHVRTQSQNQLSFDLSETQSEKKYVCDVGELLDSYEDERLDSRLECECQADNFAGCLLLPKNLFKMAVNSFLSEGGINRSGLKGGELDFVIQKLSDLFEAPAFAVLLRLKKLIYI